jgi:NAD(P)-dependent dehydrogenase (short-subunit alcohol dehydrogenase family)
MSSPIVLILGAGSNVGQHVARAFAAKGYKIALAARTVRESDNTSEQINVPSDFADPDSIVTAFAKVKASLGVPSVVIYNASAGKPNDAKNPLSLPLAQLNNDFTINTASAFVAAQQAVLGFEQLPASASRTFIFTGNVLNTTIIAPLLSAGVGKSATAHIIQNAASAYADRGYK